MPIWQNTKNLGGSRETIKQLPWSRQIVSVDQLESSTPGLIAQLKGKLSQQRYKYATVFVDQFPGYVFVYLQKRLTSEGTVMVKHAFEHSAEKHGVKLDTSGCLMVEVPCLDHLWDGQKDQHNNEEVIWLIGSGIACIACLYKPHDSLTTIGSPIGALVGLL